MKQNSEEAESQNTVQLKVAAEEWQVTAKERQVATKKEGDSRTSQVNNADDRTLPRDGR